MISFMASAVPGKIACAGLSVIPLLNIQDIGGQRPDPFQLRAGSLLVEVVSVPGLSAETPAMPTHESLRRGELRINRIESHTLPDDGWPIRFLDVVSKRNDGSSGQAGDNGPVDGLRDPWSPSR